MIKKVLNCIWYISYFLGWMCGMIIFKSLWKGILVGVIFWGLMFVIYILYSHIEEKINDKKTLNDPHNIKIGYIWKLKCPKCQSSITERHEPPFAYYYKCDKCGYNECFVRSELMKKVY